MTDVVEHVVMRRVAWRVLPLLGFGYYVNALDRSNIAVAALTMNHSLGFTAAEYGLGAGAFFWTYVALQVPANMLLLRLGARRWLTAIILGWALCSGATALVSGVRSFVIVRLLLGAAEAGYFSGVIFFLTCWFPDRYRGRAMGVFYAFAAAAISTGAPISGNILALHGWLGLQGWQWIFILEAAPAVVLAALAPFILRDGPMDAPWLQPAERQWLQATLDAERHQNTGKQLRVLVALRSVPVILMTVAYVLIGFGVYANVFFLPLMIKDLRFSNLITSYLAAVPAALGVLGMVLVSRSSDRTGERVWHVTLSALVAGVGLVVAGIAQGQILAELISLCIVGFAISAALPTFWNLPTAYFGASAAAAGIAMINSIGNVAGYFAPQLVGVLRDMTGNYGLALIVVGVMAIVAAAILPFAGAPARAAQLRRAVAD